MLPDSRGKPRGWDAGKYDGRRSERNEDVRRTGTITESPNRLARIANGVMKRAVLSMLPTI